MTSAMFGPHAQCDWSGRLMDVRPDSHLDEDTPFETMVQHLAYLLDRLGEDRVALDSDFDGGLHLSVDQGCKRFAEPHWSSVCAWLRRPLGVKSHSGELS